MRKYLKATASWPARRLIIALIVSNAVSLFLFLIRVFGAENFRFWFLFWNLWLAWLPLLFAIMLVRNLRSKRWNSWPNVLLTVLWLSFLPNSFYIISDLIHVHLTGEINILFDVVWFFSCIFNSLVFGYTSLYLVHRELIKRFKPHRAHMVIGLILVVCSFAIYLGRYLRWNSWDVLINPFGLLFDVSDRLINPVAHPQAVVTTFSFFLLLSSMYYVIFEFVQAIRGQKT